MCRQSLDRLSRFDFSVGPANNKRYAVPAFVRRALCASHSPVETSTAFGARSGPIVGHEYKDGVVGQTFVVQQFHQPGHVVIDIGDHAIKRGLRNIWIVFVHFRVLFRAIVRTVWSVGRNVSKERFVFVGFDKFQSFVKPNVGAEAFELLEFSIDDIGVIKVIIAPIIGSLSYSARAVIDTMFEPSVFWSKGIAIAQMPLSKNRCSIAVRIEDVSHRGFPASKHASPLNRMPDTYSIRVTTGHQC